MRKPKTQQKNPQTKTRAAKRRGIQSFDTGLRVLEGEGAYTAVDGEKAMMRPFDLVLTPARKWHDHGNPTSQPMIWLDGLDIPTVRHFEAGFAEGFPQISHPSTASSDDTPSFHYPYAMWRKTLDSMHATVQPDAHLGHVLELLNPADGGPAMPTISAHVRLLPRGFETRPRRSTDGTVFVVVEGKGRASVGTQTLELSPRDIFVVPSWTSLSLEARAPLVLFAFSDKAAQQKLDLYREECS